MVFEASEHSRVEQLKGLRYKLRMFGVPINGPDIYYDNQSVVDSLSLRHCRVQKKHNVLCFHKVRKAAAIKLIKMTKSDGTGNLVDLFTKKVLTMAMRKKYLGSFCYW